MEIQFQDTPEQAAALSAELEKLRDVPGPIMAALQKAQDIYGYLPFEVQNNIADFFNVPLQDLYGVVTFYSQFHLKPRGQHKIGVCLGTACYVKGAGDLVDRLKRTLKLEPGETSADAKFTLEVTRCVGCCGLAPVITVNEDVYGKLVPDDVDRILKKYK